jgi:hypothetical protein
VIVCLCGLAACQQTVDKFGARKDDLIYTVFVTYFISLAGKRYFENGDAISTQKSAVGKPEGESQAAVNVRK